MGRVCMKLSLGCAPKSIVVAEVVTRFVSCALESIVGGTARCAEVMCFVEAITTLAPFFYPVQLCFACSIVSSLLPFNTIRLFLFLLLFCAMFCKKMDFVNVIYRYCMLRTKSLFFSKYFGQGEYGGRAGRGKISLDTVSI